MLQAPIKKINGCWYRMPDVVWRAAFSVLILIFLWNIHVWVRDTHLVECKQFVFNFFFFHQNEDKDNILVMRLFDEDFWCLCTFFWTQVFFIFFFFVCELNRSVMVFAIGWLILKKCVCLEIWWHMLNVDFWNKDNEFF